MSEYLSAKQVACKLGISEAALARMRCKGNVKKYRFLANGNKHPLATLPYIKIGHCVRYKNRDVEKLAKKLRISS